MCSRSPPGLLEPPPLGKIGLPFAIPKLFLTSQYKLEVVEYKEVFMLFEKDKDSSLSFAELGTAMLTKLTLQLKSFFFQIKFS